MKSIAFFLLFLGLVSLSMARSSNFLDELFQPTVNTGTPTSCNATDTCAGEGKACVGNYNGGAGTGGCLPMNGTCCAMGLFCTANKTCSDNTQGLSCNANSDCFPSELICTVNKTCEYVMGIGDPCTANSLCTTGNCTGGTCMGKSGNQTCGSSADCDFGLYCNNMTCSNTIPQGSTCTMGGAPCYPGNVCFQKSFGNASMTCQAIGSQSAGGPCTALACGSGLVCGGNSTAQFCVNVNSSTVPCTNNANCTSPATCICSSVTGSSYCMGSAGYSPCTSEVISLAQCMATSKCPGLPSEAPDSCTQSNCESEYKKSQSCDCSYSNSIYGKCTYGQFCGGFPVWAIIVIIVVAIVLVLAIVLLVFFMMRRRRQYDSI